MRTLPATTLLFPENAPARQGGANAKPFGDVVKGYTLAWSDEFDGAELNLDKWQYRTDSKHWSTQLPDNVAVRDGNLILHVKKEKSQGKEYTGGGIISKPQFKFGYFETSMRIPPGSGWHTSFWLMGYDGNGGTDIEKTVQEIDIIENDSSNLLQYNVNFHNWRSERPVTLPGEKTIVLDKAGQDLSEAFHVVGCEFTPEGTKYFLDGKLVHTIDSSLLIPSDHNIWLTTIASHLGNKPVDDTLLPAEAAFEYVRVFQLADTI
jgi:beta-glucanase (GH16 family)